MSRRTLWGLAAAAAYVGVALLLPGGPTRPLFDISTPQPYRWVNPPAIYAPGNVPPKGSTHTVELTAAGSAAASFATADGQAAVVFKEGTFRPRSGEKQVAITIEPLDPATIGAPPAGLRYDGNAYRFIARYAKSHADAALSQPATIVLRFPIVATKLFRRDGEVWTVLNANPVGASLQIYGDSTMLGAFVAIGPPLDTNTKIPRKKFPAALVISLGAAAVAVVAGLIARMRIRRRKQAARTRRVRRPPGRQRPPGQRPPGRR